MFSKFFDLDLSCLTLLPSTGKQWGWTKSSYPGFPVCRPDSRALNRISGFVLAKISSVLVPVVTAVEKQTPLPTMLNCNKSCRKLGMILIMIDPRDVSKGKFLVKHMRWWAEWGFTYTFPRNQDVTVKLKSELFFFYKMLVFLSCPCRPQANLFHTNKSINVWTVKRS